MNTPLLIWRWLADDQIWTATHPLWDQLYVVRRVSEMRGNVVCVGGKGRKGGVGGWRALDENGDAIGSPHRSHVVAAHACSARLMRDLVRIEASKDEAMADRMTCRRLIDEFNLITRRKIAKKRPPTPTPHPLGASNS